LRIKINKYWWDKLHRFVEEAYFWGKMMRDKLRIGTRGSKLALWQAERVQEALLTAFSELQFEIKIIKTLGDRLPELNLLDNQGKGVFCSEIENALLNQEIDLAVHSIKDLPGKLPPGLVLGGFLKREDPREVLITREGVTFGQLPAGARFGTSSIRRLVQLKQIRPDLEYAPIRGNVETRIQKVLDGQYDATILALAGIRRLNLEHCITQIFSLAEVIPAPGQGVIGVEVSEENTALVAMLAQITDRVTAYEVRAERAFLERMGGNCRSAYGAYAKWDDGLMEMRGLFGENEANLVVKQLVAPISNVGEAVKLGSKLATELLK